MFKSPLGMKDILPDEAYLWQDIENKAKEIFCIYGYAPIATPILEDSRLFNRTLGSETEIVKKQMFLVKRTHEEYCLRPEGTAAIARAYLENNLEKKAGFTKFYYIGPMFRAERPQKGRLRQFHHIGVEAIGANSPCIDSEVISLADSILRELGIDGCKIKINSLGCLKDKSTLAKILSAALKDKIKNLCDDCRQRLGRNVFRILDCKNEACKKVVCELGLDYETYLCGDCLGHFQAVKQNLDNINVAYTYEAALVRGLDYYTRTVFEITHSSSGLGSQDAIGAGGRYDNLISELGGPQLGAVGFALGIERMLLAINKKAQLPSQNLQVFIVTLGNKAKKEGFVLLNRLRKEGIPSEIDYEDKSLKAQMRLSNDKGVRFAGLLGENELEKKVVTLKDMKLGTQEEINIDTFIEELKTKLREER